MAGPEDPIYIHTLFSQSTDHNCYFVVGDPRSGEVERIGVVSAMLMAHSMVLRRALNIQVSDNDERWDIPIIDMKPKTFKNMLRYTYGFNNIKTHSMVDAIELLSVAEQYMMEAMMRETILRIKQILDSSNVCIALQNPVCLHIDAVASEITKVVQTSTEDVLKSEHFSSISPEGMSFLVLLESLQVPAVQLWRAVVKWARVKVLKEENCDVNLELYGSSSLIVPISKYIQSCTLNLIQLVKKMCTNNLPIEDGLPLLSSFHLVATNPLKRIFLCTQCNSETNCITHEEFEVKVIVDCSAWLQPILVTQSEIRLITTTSVIELHALVCTASKRADQFINVMKQEKHENNKLQEYTYHCSCTIRIFCTTADKGDKEEALLCELTFQEFLWYSEEFLIPLTHNGSNSLKLEPHNNYSIQIQFTTPHPLCYSSDLDYVSPIKNNLIVECGIINTEKLWYGTHVKYVLYRAFGA